MPTFEEKLKTYYEENGRDLPWRENASPYTVLLSEVMLQQTRVEAVKAYYRRFLSRFPDVKSLAESEEDEVLKLWEGLGYYSRARNLRKAAIAVMENFDGEFPSSKKELLSLPGVGEYTSSAIASIAFHKKDIAVDGNLLRVFARLTSYPHDIKSPKAKEDCYDYLSSRLKKIDPSIFNQSLMDLGEITCIPNGAPHCESCPLADICLAHKQKLETSFPVVPPKKEKPHKKMTVLLFLKDSKVGIVKRPSSGLLANLYGFPMEEGHYDENALRDLLASKGIKVLRMRPMIKKKHVFTHLVWDMEGYPIEVADAPVRFVSEKERQESYSLPSAFKGLEEELLKLNLLC